MKWSILKYNQPINGQECIIGFITNKGKRFKLGTYFSNSWDLHNSGNIKCSPNDHWCAVDDVIEYVENKIETEIISAFEDEYNY